MDVLWIIVGSILMLAGIAGCILPAIPGPPLSFIGLLLLQLTDKRPFTVEFLIIWALVVTAVTVLDYIVPVWGTKRFGGSKLGVWGSTAGLILGLVFLPPLGMILGPFLGAVVGEMISGKEISPALRAGFGSFMGFLAGTVMKLAVSLIMTFYFVKAII
jgi:hypothetical protein